MKFLALIIFLSTLAAPFNGVLGAPVLNLRRGTPFTLQVGTCTTQATTPTTPGFYKATTTNTRTQEYATRIIRVSDSLSPQDEQHIIRLGLEAITQGLAKFPWHILTPSSQPGARFLFFIEPAYAAGLPLDIQEIEKTIEVLSIKIDAKEAFKGAWTKERAREVYPQLQKLKTERALWTIIRDAIAGMDPDNASFVSTATYREIKKLIAQSIMESLLEKLGVILKDPYIPEAQRFTSGLTFNVANAVQRYAPIAQEIEQRLTRGSGTLPRWEYEQRQYQKADELSAAATTLTQSLHTLVKSQETILDLADFLTAQYYANLLRTFLMWPYQNKGVLKALLAPTSFIFVTENKILEALAEDQDMWDLVTMLDDILVKTEQLLVGPAQRLKYLINAKKRIFEGLKKEILSAKTALSNTPTPEAPSNKASSSTSTSLAATAPRDPMDQQAIRNLLLFLSGDNDKKSTVICDVKSIIQEELVPSLVAQAQKRLGNTPSSKNTKQLLQAAASNLTSENPALTTLIQDAITAAGTKLPDDALKQVIHEAEIRIVVEGFRGLTEYQKECNPEALKLSLAKMFDQILEDFMNEIRSSTKTLTVINSVDSEALRIILKTGVNASLKAKLQPDQNFDKIRTLLVKIDNLVAWLREELTLSGPQSLQYQWMQLVAEITAHYSKLEYMMTDMKVLLQKFDNPNRIKRKK